MEGFPISTAIKLVFSPNERRKVRERQEIVQRTFQTILEHQPIGTDRESSKLYALQEPDPNTVYRGTSVGWVVFAALKEGLISSDGYDGFAIATNNPSKAIRYPDGNASKIEDDIKNELGRIKRKERINLTSQQINELVKKLSQTTVLSFVGLESNLASVSESLTMVRRLPIANLSEMSANVIKNLIGINPIELAKR